MFIMRMAVGPREEGVEATVAKLRVLVLEEDLIETFELELELGVEVGVVEIDRETAPIELTAERLGMVEDGPSTE